jgi:membrane-associated phospholipid phosphatase
MLHLFKKNLWFFVPYLAFLLIAGSVLLIFTKIDIHIFINSLHFPLGDYIFKYGTYIGDGIVVALLIFIMLFVRYRYAIALSLSALSITAVVQSFKYFILPEIDRPWLHFEKVAKTVDLYYVPGVDLHIINSFPSGHTTSAFTIFLFLALISKNNLVKLLCFIMALSIGYSRVYLSQHFLNDIYFGSLFAVFFVVLFYLWCSSWKNKKLDLSLLHTLRLNKKKNYVEKS